MKNEVKDDTMFDESKNNVVDKEDAKEFYEDIADTVGAQGDNHFSEDFDGELFDPEVNNVDDAQDLQEFFQDITETATGARGCGRVIGTFSQEADDLKDEK